MSSNFSPATLSDIAGQYWLFISRFTSYFLKNADYAGTFVRVTLNAVAGFPEIVIL